MALFEALGELVAAAIVSTAPSLKAGLAAQALPEVRDLPRWLKDNGGASSLDAVVDAMARDIWLGPETRSLSQQLLEHHASALGQILLVHRPQQALLEQAIDRARTGAGAQSDGLPQRISVDIFSRAKDAGGFKEHGLKDDIALFMIDRVFGHLLDDPATTLSLAEPLARHAGQADVAASTVVTAGSLPAGLDLSVAAGRALEQSGGTSFLAELRERFTLSERAMARLLKLVDQRASSRDSFVIELERLAAWLGEIKGQLIKPSNEDAEVRRLKGRAAAALSDGDFETAADALRQIRREIRESRRRTEERLADEVAGLRSQMAEEARATARLGELRFAAQDFAAAADLFSEAALALPSAERETAWRYDLQKAEALLGLGLSGTDQKGLTDAATAFAHCVRTAAEVSDRKGLAQASLGLSVALASAGESDATSTVRLKDAVPPLKKAIGIFAREADSDARAAAALRLGRVLALIGERDKSAAGLREATEVYRDALKSIEPARLGAMFSAAQMGLGNALLSLEERDGGAPLLAEAASAYAAALEHLDRTIEPATWAEAQLNLGIASLGLGEQTGDAAQLGAAIAAFERASDVSTREAAPQRWALIQLNLGNAHAALGEKQKTEVAHVERSIAAYSAALDEFKRESEPLKWAIAQMSLGTGLIRLGEHRDKRRNWLAAASTMVPALEVFEAQGATQYADVTRQSLKMFHDSWDQLLTPTTPEKPAAPRLSKAV